MSERKNERKLFDEDSLIIEFSGYATTRDQVKSIAKLEQTRIDLVAILNSPVPSEEIRAAARVELERIVQNLEDATIALLNEYYSLKNKRILDEIVNFICPETHL